MFKIKRKLIMLICTAAVILSGCEKRENPPVNVFSTDAQNSRPFTQSTASVKSSVQNTEIGSAQPIASSNDIKGDPPEISDMPVIEGQITPYSHDPQNACSITFNGTSIIVKGKYGDLFSDVMENDPPMSIDCVFDGEELVCTLTPKSNKFDQKYGSFYILDKNNYLNIVNIELDGSGIKFPDVSSLVQGNENVTNSSANISEAKTAQYITTDGSRERIPQILNDIQKLSDDICNGIDDDYEKLRAISYWVSENIYYDYPAHNKGIPQECLSLEYMLNNRSSVCGGYSNMTSALCAAQGIRCLNITGMAINNDHCFLQGVSGEYHEWNVAEIDGRRIIVDSGWNSLNTFRADGTFASKPICYKYFDIGEDVFALDHKAQTAEYRDYWALA